VEFTLKPLKLSCGSLVQDNLALLYGASSRGLLCLEINPVRGVDVDPVFSRLEKSGVLSELDFLNVTDCALARMKCNSLIFAAVLKQRLGIEVLVNLACRDRNSIALQADLLGGNVLGVKSIVALTGDAVSVGDNSQAKAVFEFNSLGLLNIVNTLSSGRDLANNQLQGRLDLTAGVVTNPNSKNPQVELRRLKAKFDAGAKYALTQPVFDVDSSYEFLQAAQEIGIPIMLGLMPIKSRKSADLVCQIPGIKVPTKFISAIEAFKDTASIVKYSFDYCQELVEKNKNIVSGFHIISGANPQLSMELVKAVAPLCKQLKYRANLVEQVNS
jgi:5,10-methylenetetrahydrofolate reductase